LGAIHKGFQSILGFQMTDWRYPKVSSKYLPRGLFGPLQGIKGFDKSEICEVISINQSSVIFGFLARKHKFDFGSKASLFNNLRFRHATLTVQLMLPYDSTNNDCLDA
jgi:hypothetical protein